MMGLLRAVLKNPLHAAILGAAVGGILAYVWISCTDSGKAYGASGDVQRAYLQAIGGGAAALFGVSYLFFSGSSDSAATGPAGVMGEQPLLAGGAPAMGMGAGAVGLGDGVEPQTMMTGSFD